MDNQDSQPSLSPPIIPDEWCPGGKTPAEVFNEYNELFLAQTVINIPGIGLVTPSEIAAINATLVLLQNEIDALDKQIRSGTEPLAAGDQNIVLAFVPVMPSADYRIIVNMADTAAAATVTFNWAYDPATKNANGVTLRFYDIPASVDSFDWWVVQN